MENTREKRVPDPMYKLRPESGQNPDILSKCIAACPEIGKCAELRDSLMHAQAL